MRRGLRTESRRSERKFLWLSHPPRNNLNHCNRSTKVSRSESTVRGWSSQDGDDSRNGAGPEGRTTGPEEGFRCRRVPDLWSSRRVESTLGRLPSGSVRTVASDFNGDNFRHVGGGKDVRRGSDLVGSLSRNS